MQYINLFVVIFLVFCCYAVLRQCRRDPILKSDPKPFNFLNLDPIRIRQYATILRIFLQIF